MAIANEHARQIWAMLAHDVDYDPRACLHHPMHRQTQQLEGTIRFNDSLQRQRDTVDNRSDHPEANLTNWMDAQTVIRLIPDHRTVP